MCIIAAKPAGIPMPNEDTIENMWFANSNGAGFMYAKDGVVHIEKGFMKYTAFTDRLERLEREIDTTKTAIVLHFRITTSGGTTPENCHPFPVSDNIPILKKLVCNTNFGIAHNGIIPISPRSKDISDTMEYIASQLAPLYRFNNKFYKNKDAMLLVKNAIQSKMCFLNPEGEIYTIGDFENVDGMLYSNGSYKSYWKSSRYINCNYYSGYNDDYDDDTYLYESYWNKSNKNKGLVNSFGFVNDAGFYVEPRYLMCLSEIDGFGISKTAVYIPGEDLYTDRYDNCWVYDPETDTCFKTSDITLYNGEGDFAKYDFTAAERMYCNITK